MRKFTDFLLRKGSLLLLFMLVQVAVFGQNPPELMYYVFDAPGNQPNYASTPVGSNPAPLLGLAIGGTGQFGTALIGNGGSSSSNSLNTGWAPNLGNSNWTISLWLNGVSNVGNSSPYYLFGDVNSSSFRCFAEGAAGQGSLLLRGGGLNDVLVSGVAPGPSVVTFVHTSGNVRVFLNGVYVNDVSQGTLSVNGSGPFLVGGYSSSTGMNSGCLLDEFRFYNRALADAEVTATWNTNLLAKGNISGTVTNSYNGNPIAGATVTCGSATTTTAGDGTYTLTDIFTGNRVVTCSATNFITQNKTVLVAQNQTSTCNFALEPVPAYVNGVVRNAANSAPLIGARVWVTSTNYTYSIAGGVYSLHVYPGGDIIVHAIKAGFDEYVSDVMTVAQGNTYTLDINLNENLNAPGPVTAVLNSPQTAVNLNWQTPWGNYEQIYDDGVAEGFAIWASGGNFNAVKFTPVGTPCQVTGGMINIGSIDDYPSGANPLVPFQVAVYDATGPGGTPGQVIGGPFDITPTALGWNEFTFPSAVDIPSGNFYLVQIQGGNSPNAAGCAIDTTSTQLRSYQKFVTGSGPWVPISGNLMIRATIYGAGGPLLDLPGNTAALLGYQIWRLTQGNEANPGTWTSIAQVTGTSTIDNSWPTLDCGPYRWAVEAQYTGNRWSTATFSNVIGKCWTAGVTVNVTLSCDSTSVNYTKVQLMNTAYPDTVYNATLVGTNTVTFPKVWKGSYTLTVSHFGYTDYVQNVTIMGDQTIDVMVMQIKVAPYDLTVNDVSLLSTWRPPLYMAPFFTEDWSSGSYSTNGWTTEGSNWVISSDGNPGPSAEFYWSPEQTNYQFSLTSTSFEGSHSPKMWLKFDLTLSNYGNTALNYLAVELWNGSTWSTLETWDNSSGSSFNWKPISEDISAMTNSSNFKIRFRAYGDDTYYINYWGIDNIQLLGANDPEHDPCVLGYNFYLNSVLSAYTPDTFYTIPSWQVHYGNSYQACVLAVYGSGYSAKSCVNFTSHFLCPPTNLAAQQLENVAYLTWSKPACGGGGTPIDFIFDDGTYETGWGINPGYVEWLGNYFPIDPNVQGVLQSFDAYFFTNAGGTYYLSLDIFDGTGNNIVGSSDLFLVPADDWVTIDLNDVPFHGPFYAMVKWDNLSASTNWFGEDTDGYTGGDIAYDYYGPGTWTLLSSYGYSPGAFLLRGHGMAYDKKEMLILPQGAKPVAQNAAPRPSLARVNVASTQAIAKQMNAPTADPVLTGYVLYRNSAYLTDLVGPDVLEYYDVNPNPGHICYTVTAKYDMTAFGFPSAESLESNEACLLMNYGRDIPFYEPWDMGNFSFNDWTLDPASPNSNWSINSATGNPAPSADFSWMPFITNYNESLTTPTLNAGGWTCAHIWLDFDYQLVDRNATGAEKLTVELFVNNVWMKQAEFVNNGSVDWTPQHIEISMVKGKSFMVRFRANGVNSADILHWYVDNIHIYGICTPPTDLAYTQSQFTTTLTWTPPVCGNGAVLMDFIFDDGTWEDGYRYLTGNTGWYGNEFPITASLAGVLQTIHVYFVDNGSGAVMDMSIDIFDGTQTLVGSSGTFSANAPDVWLDVDVNNIPFSGLFYAMVKWTAAPVNSYFLAMDLDGPYSADDLEWAYDGTTFTKQSSVYGSPFVFFVRATALVGGDLKQVELTPKSIRPVGQPSNNTGKVSLANRKGDSGNHSIMGLQGNADSTTVTGYNVYRTGNTGALPFSLLNNTTATTYVDTYPNTTEPGAVFKYYVTALMQNSITGLMLPCEPASDTITVTFPALGVNELTNSDITLYPNPATDLVNVVSTYNIKSIEMLNYIGQTVYTNANADTKKMQLSVSTLKAGVYFVKVTTDQGIRTVKITVTH